MVAPTTTCVGSIPAWAGETPAPFVQFAISRVYPRVGGGNRITAALVDIPQGLSPRGRGKRNAKSVGAVIERSIPAWAGETETPTPTPCLE